jgi:predicted peptidase
MPQPSVPYSRGRHAGRTYRYHAPAVRGAERLPLILFLHGVDERGDDGDAPLGYGFFREPAALFGASTLAAHPAYVLVPQAPLADKWVEIRRWNDLSYHQAPAPTPALAEVLELLEEFMGAHAVDPARVYATGLSMGAFGALDLAARRPELFAAAVAVCGGGDPATAAAARSVPIYALHGALDQVVPVEFARRQVAAVLAAGGSARLTVYPDEAHDVWDRAFADPALAQWLFRQSRR